MGLIDAVRAELRRALQRRILLFVAAGMVVFALGFLALAADICLAARIGAAGAAAVIALALLILALVLVLVARQSRPQSAISVPVAALIDALRSGLGDKALPLTIAALIAGVILARSSSRPTENGKKD